MCSWSIDSAREMYKIDQWGLGYFSINERGNLCVSPDRSRRPRVDLRMLVDELRRRKINTPLLIRVMNILEDRIKSISHSFQDAMEAFAYEGTFRPLFPVKVNQQRQVVEAIINYGTSYGLGLEAGSKPELLMALGVPTQANTPIVCNGYKDQSFVEMVAMAHRLGKKIIPVIEKCSEVELFLSHYEQTGILPLLGIRLKLATRGAGQWAASGGEHSKFGLTIPEFMYVIERLKASGNLDRLKMLHFHIGSQITEINVVKQAIAEAGRVFVETWRLGVRWQSIDVGGGLGIDYDGSSQDTYSTINYTTREYARDIVHRIQLMCDDHGIPHPNLLTESGRFLSAHYSLLITNIASMHGKYEPKFDPEKLETIRPLSEMMRVAEGINDANFLERYHEAQQLKQEMLNAFNLGYLSIETRAYMEHLYKKTVGRVLQLLPKSDKAPDELSDLAERHTETYYANFSLFQSLPDSWAIGQIFPIAPIHRLDQQPQQRGLVVDLTCDSDGVIRDYLKIEQHDHYVPLHDLNASEPYYIGVFLVGAYQETLGELHNLFGDTHAVQIEITGDNRYRIVNLTKGDAVEDVLRYVSFDPGQLANSWREQVESAVGEGLLDLDEAAHIMDQYEKGLKGYTYFDAG